MTKTRLMGLETPLEFVDIQTLLGDSAMLVPYGCRLRFDLHGRVARGEYARLFGPFESRALNTNSSFAVSLGHKYLGCPKGLVT